jgi:hypothetical protein
MRSKPDLQTAPASAQLFGGFIHVVERCHRRDSNSVPMCIKELSCHRLTDESIVSKRERGLRSKISLRGR